MKMYPQAKDMYLTAIAAVTFNLSLITASDR